MRRFAVLALLSLAACTDPLGLQFPHRWTMHVDASACWSAFSVDFSVDGNGIGQWSGGGRVVADGSNPSEARFFPESGGRGADYARGTFTDPHGIMTGGGACVSDAELVRR